MFEADASASRGRFQSEKSWRLWLGEGEARAWQDGGEAEARAGECEARRRRVQARPKRS